MNICQYWICFFLLSALGGRNSDVVDAEILQHTGTEGGNITVGCTFAFSGKKKIFCRNECEDGDILIKTEDIEAKKGRYSINYREGSFPQRSTLLYVSITKLNKSDSGRYRCGLERSFPFSASYRDIEITVQEAPTSSKPNFTFRPSPSSVSTASTSSSFSTSSSSSTLTTSAAGSEVLLYVVLTLVILVIILSAAVLVFCRKRASKAREPPEENEYVNVTNGEENGQSRTPPVGMALFNSNAAPNGGEITSEYSFVTAVSSQKEAEDDSSKLTYSQVNFSGAPPLSAHSGVRGEAENVVYSVPQVAASGSRYEDTSPPLYSTVTSH